MRTNYIWPDPAEYDQRPWRVFTRAEVQAMPIHQSMFDVPMNIPCMSSFMEGRVKRLLDAGEPFEFMYLWRPQYNNGHKARGLCQ